MPQYKFKLKEKTSPNSQGKCDMKFEAADPAIGSDSVIDLKNAAGAGYTQGATYNVSITAA